MRILPAAAAASLLVAVVGAVPAVAAPPVNDTYTGRVTVTEPLPITYTQDTSEATTEAFDQEFASGCEGIPSTDASVWFEYTPTAEGGYLVDVSASDFPAGGVVASWVDGAWQVEACGPGAFAWFAMAGTTYTIMVVDDQSDGVGNGGMLNLTVDVTPPPPTLDITVDKYGTFNSKTGEARITGTATCTPATEGEEGFADLEVQLSQRVGRILIRGWGYTSLDCDGATRTWEAIISGDNGLFKGGKAANVTVGYACGAFDCSINFIESTVQLRGVRKA